MTVIYIDEAGRGPLAGPVQVGLVMPVDKKKISRKSLFCYMDSKVLSHKRREELFDKINADQRFLVSTASSSARIIDKYGIIKAQQKALLKGLRELVGDKEASYSLGRLNDGLKKHGVEKLSIDGNHPFGLDKKLIIPVETVVKGDSLISEISMASILAKVTRDRYMVRQASKSKKYKYYGFEKHKGYGTQLHRDMISIHGACDLHRISFISAFIS